MVLSCCFRAAWPKYARVSGQIKSGCGFGRREFWGQTGGAIGVEDGIWVAHDCFRVEVDCFVVVS